MVIPRQIYINLEDYDGNKAIRIAAKYGLQSFVLNKQRLSVNDNLLTPNCYAATKFYKKNYETVNLLMKDTAGIKIID